MLEACKWQATALLDSEPKGRVLAQCAPWTWLLRMTTHLLQHGLHDLTQSSRSICVLLTR